MTRIFVYEFVGAGGLHDPDPGLLAAGVAMRDAILKDLLRVPGVRPTCAIARASDRSLRATGSRATGDGATGSSATGRGAASPGGTDTRASAFTPPRPANARATALACPRADETPEAFVRRMADLHDLCWVVAPETGGCLAGLCAAVGEHRWIGCSAAAIALASSKRATTRALEAAGIATPRSFAAGATRWVVKPDDGAGTVDTRLHASLAAARADCAARQRTGQRCALEPYVEGEALSVSLQVGMPPGGAAEAVSFNRQHIEIDAAGTMHDGGVECHAIDPRRDPRAARLHALARDVAQALPGLRGFAGIDLVWHAGRGPVVIEVNPRVTCAYVGLSERLGRNVAADILAAHQAPATSHAAAA